MLWSWFTGQDLQLAYHFLDEFVESGCFSIFASIWINFRGDQSHFRARPFAACGAPSANKLVQLGLWVLDILVRRHVHVAIKCKSLANRVRIINEPRFAVRPCFA